MVAAVAVLDGPRVLAGVVVVVDDVALPGPLEADVPVVPGAGAAVAGGGVDGDVAELVAQGVRDVGVVGVVDVDAVLGLRPRYRQDGRRVGRAVGPAVRVRVGAAGGGDAYGEIRMEQAQ